MKTQQNFSIDEYIRQESVALGEKLEGRKAIYLDTRFWVILRQIHTGEKNIAKGKEFLSLLKELVRTEKVFCPLSPYAFLEFCKQPIHRLKETAKLVDELSTGVSLKDPITLQRAELFHFFRSVGGDLELHPLRNMVWTKLSYVLGTLVPTWTEMATNEAAYVQKSFYDFMGQISFSQMIDILGDSLAEFLPLPGSKPAKMNFDVAANAKELRSLEQTYKIELRGIIDILGEEAAYILHIMACEQVGMQHEPTPNQWKLLNNAGKNILLESFKKEETKHQLKMIHVGVSLHADLRWNKGQKFKPNDLIDFNHASQALAFCDAFFTERKLAIALSDRLHIDQLFNCSICHKVEDALNTLQGIADSD
ncbi:hypothetical protein [Sneathiella sp.]|jgi:hypothetical protein|uniref:hypothetical protein n=1 Tax=Sneathiella sp. TaxID=1964365 RepID=UPI0039E4ABC2